MYCNILSLRLLGRGVRMDCRDSVARELIIANYGQTQAHHFRRHDLEYSVARSGRGSGFRIARRGREPLIAADDGEFIFLLEKDITIELQRLRRDLYFIHAAALALSDKAILLVAASGKGKSTTSWALLHQGFGYLSDELAPLDLENLEVHPYPHALCLKKEPPHPYSLPAETARTSSTLHVPVRCLPGPAVMQAMPLAAIFFIEYCPELKFPTVHALGKAEAAARLFVQALNPLAHPEDGLAGAVAVVQRIPSFRVDSADLRLTCELIQDTLPKETVPECRSPAPSLASRDHAL